MTDGRAEERAAIVTWLRERAVEKRALAGMLTAPGAREKEMIRADYLARVAGQIERGEHLEGTRRAT